MRRVAAPALERFIGEVLLTAGASNENAAVVARSLTESHLTGHDTHGLVWLERYADDVADGLIDPLARPEVVVSQSGAAVVDGRWGFGQVTARAAVTAACELAARQGVGVAAARRCNHVGRVGEYAEQAADAGCVGLVLCRAGGRFPTLAPHGGRVAVLGTNPIALGVPLGSDRVVIDMASSALSESAVRRASQEGRSVPEGALLDAAGAPTTRPGALYEGGAMLPAGGHKGYSLALVVELLAGALTGVGRPRERAPRGGSGLLVLALRPDAFADGGEVGALLAAVCDSVRSSPPAAGFSEVLLPGERSRRHREERTRAGVPVEGEPWEVMRRLAARFGVAPPAGE